MMSPTDNRVTLYERLPEIYRIRDEEVAAENQTGELRAYLGLFEAAFGEIHGNIEALYHDLFIDTCDDWVIPYLADLLGSTHLKGDPATLRADVADTIALRRRKGTRHALELLSSNLTRWAAHAVELRDHLLWPQNLNHQRPDGGGESPFPELDRFSPFKRGTIPVRDPASLSLLGTTFDGFGKTPDLRPQSTRTVRPNLPNLALFLWRLQDYRIPLVSPGLVEGHPVADAPAKFAVRVAFDPQQRRIRLFNTNRAEPHRTPPLLSRLDETPGPVLAARLTSNAPAGNPDDYLAIVPYDETRFPEERPQLTDVGTHFFVPFSSFSTTQWKTRGDNLCAWEIGLRRPLNDKEIVVDPNIGRAVIGVKTKDERDALLQHLLLSYTYGAPGPVGAHPVDHGSAPEKFNGQDTDIRRVGEWLNPTLPLQDALANLNTATKPVVVEIADSQVHDLDPATLLGLVDGDIALKNSLIIRGADGQRPVIRLKAPLRFAPATVTVASASRIPGLTVKFEGVLLTRDDGFTGNALIERAAVDALEIIDSTLDPGGERLTDGNRATIAPSMRLTGDYDFTAAKLKNFPVVPDIAIDRSIIGPILADSGYRFFIQDSILDAGAGTKDPEASAFGPLNDVWGAELEFNHITVFGSSRPTRISRGTGGIWTHPLQVRQHQEGCLRQCTFPASGNRLPAHRSSIFRDEAVVHFTDIAVNEPGYGQLSLDSTWEIRERGPKDDEMGSYHFLLNSHRWHNLQIRFREFSPAGIAPHLIPVT